MHIPKEHTNRILSIDIMRGITLFLMLFVNDIYAPGVPGWLLHTEAATDGMGLSDWVFPGFLFMVGMSIPHAISSRRKKGESTGVIFLHIVARTLSLLLIGILMLNVGRFNAALSGMNPTLWAVLVYICIFLIWNTYPQNTPQGAIYRIFRILGVLGLLALAAVFRAGDADDPTWLRIEWWGILGLIGWGYFIAATACLFLHSKLPAVALLWVFFILLNVLSQLGLSSWLNFLNPVFGVILAGNVPAIVLAGLTVGLILTRKELGLKKVAWITILLGIVCLGVGFFLRNWFILSKIYGTPSWAMVCNGISMLLYAFLFFLIDIKQKSSWAKLFEQAGKKSLTTYLAPDVLYFLCWGTGLQLFFYKQEESQLLAIAGSLGWAAAMIGFAILLSKVNVRLKL